MDLILIIGIILTISALSCKTTDKIGLPVLVGFILIGVLIGNWFKFENTAGVNQICNFALLLIIFTGGFQTNFTEAGSVLAVSSVLSMAGTVLTAGLAGAFAYFVLRLEFYQAMLLGAVISSTDAASVFSVLRSKQMELKNNLNYMLEIESGSNDPFAYMLTVMFMTLASGSCQNIVLLMLLQIIVGIAAGFIFSKLGQFLINRLNVDIDGLYGALLCGTAFLIYGAAAQFGGNGFLAVYIGGIILGNGKLMYKGFLTRLFSAVSMLMQIMLFIVLGILCIPLSIAAVVGSGLLFAFFLFFIARPVIIFALMKPFRRPLNEIALVSWAGFRGASSIVFSTYLLTAGLPYAEYVFSVVFFVCMLSVIIQGTFIVPVAKLCRLVDD
ncbi:MAG: potassium/proton antiporter [Oscillospiraceae bacterium]|nr:potassium/proton antiporter [Oscillospiraceae bacterium]